MYKLTNIPGCWSLQTVVDAFFGLFWYDRTHWVQLAQEAVAARLEEMWALRPLEAKRWENQNCEIDELQLYGTTRDEQLLALLHRRCAKECSRGLSDTPWW